MTHANDPTAHALRAAAQELMDLAKQLGVGSITVYASTDDHYANACAWAHGSNATSEPVARASIWPEEHKEE